MVVTVWLYNLCSPLCSAALFTGFTNANPDLNNNAHVLKLRNISTQSYWRCFHEPLAWLLLKRHQNINGPVGGGGAEWGKGHIDQSHAHSFSHQSTPTDKAVRLDCSFAVAVSPLYVTPRGKDNITFGKNVQLP